MPERLQKIISESGLMSRRSAEKLISEGRVTINGKPAKASTEVKVGDVIEIGFGTKTVSVEVTGIADTQKKEEAAQLYKYL